MNVVLLSPSGAQRDAPRPAHLRPLPRRLRLYDGGGLRPRLPRRQPRALRRRQRRKRHGHLGDPPRDDPRQVGDGGVCPPLLFLHERLPHPPPQEGARPHERPRHGPRRAHLASFLGDRLLRARLPHRGTRPRRAAHAALRPRALAFRPHGAARSAAAGSWRGVASAS